jgi:hypothetical protein
MTSFRERLKYAIRWISGTAALISVCVAIVSVIFAKEMKTEQDLLKLKYELLSAEIDQLRLESLEVKKEVQFNHRLYNERYNNVIRYIKK